MLKQSPVGLLRLTAFLFIMENPENKLLTVVIPVFNRGELVTRTLDSVAVQDTALFHLVIVDNSSTDNTAEVIRAWMDEHPELSAELLTETYRSASAARNRGLQAVTTPWVMFFDSDDIMLPGHVGSAVELARKNPGVDIVGWDIAVPLKNGSKRLMPFPERNVLKSHLVHGSLSTLRYMVKTGFIREAGGWNRDVRKWDDLELGVRLMLNNPVVMRRPGVPLAEILFTEESISGADFKSGCGEWEKSLDEIEKTFSRFRPGMTDWVTYRRADLAAAYRSEGAPELAARLLATAKSRTSRPWLASMLYNLKRVCPRGVWRVADIFIR